jgi:hypothetical protein
LVTFAIRLRAPYWLRMQTPAHSGPEASRAKSRRAEQRAPRIRLSGAVLAMVRLPNRKHVQARLHILSISGGMLNLDSPLEEKLKVQLTFHLVSATIRVDAEMLFPMWATRGWMQPFRFVDLSEEDQKMLELNLQPFMNQIERG